MAFSAPVIESNKRRGRHSVVKDVGSGEEVFYLPSHFPHLAGWGFFFNACPTNCIAKSFVPGEDSCFFSRPQTMNCLLKICSRINIYIFFSYFSKSHTHTYTLTKIGFSKISHFLKKKNTVR